MNSERMTRSGADGIAVAILACLVTIVGWFIWNFDDWRNGQDRITQFGPWYAFLGDHLRHGTIPAWNPHDASGTPFIGNPQSGWMFLPIMAL